jgi:NADPH-dependent 2,4-dienoyl-CoA reductase/sulfur reductase-like enzyme/nitrite reductase/ring-hydroxylating ferredoxin subunit
MSGNEPAKGPDLSQWTEVSRIETTTPFAGQIGGEAVVACRVGNDVVAVGGTCTHYGGPLGEGLVASGTVRCPWHHACFDLRTGEPIAAPALSPIARYRVERDGGRFRLVEKLPDAPMPKAGRGPRSVAIVGAGGAGFAAAEMLRRHGHEGSITLVDADPDASSDRPNLSKDYLAGSAPEEWIPLRPSGWFAEQRIERVMERAVSLDAGKKRLGLASGKDLEAEAIVLATGAVPIRLPIPGGDLPHVFTVRTLADSRKIIAAASGAKRAVVIGASFIGLEAAAALRTRGLEVHVVAPEGVPMERVLGREVGLHVRSVHEAHGVVFHLGRTPEAIESGMVRLAGGTTLPADVVVMGVGVRPDLALAEKAGLRVDKGILVDRNLRTSAAGIYAAGDNARYPDPRTGEPIRIEHWVVAERMGQCVARNLLGENATFDAVPFFWSNHFEVSISYLGHAASFDRIDVSGSIEKDDCALAYRKGGKTLALATIGRNFERLEAELAFANGDEGVLQRIVPPTKG